MKIEKESDDDMAFDSESGTKLGGAGAEKRASFDLPEEFRALNDSNYSIQDESTSAHSIRQKGDSLAHEDDASSLQTDGSALSKDEAGDLSIGRERDAVSTFDDKSETIRFIRNSLKETL